MGDAIKTAIKEPEAKKENPVSQIQKGNLYQSISSPFEQILFLQRTIGNQAVQVLMRSGALQAKLRTGAPGDIYEQEADRVAEQVIHMKENENQPHIIPAVQPLVQRQEKEKKTEEPWYRVYTGTETNKSDDYVAAGISQKIGNVTTNRVDLIKPGAKYTPPKGWDLDCFIRRDGMAKKFRGFLGIESELTAAEARLEFPQYVGDAARLFGENAKPKKETRSVLQRTAKSITPSYHISNDVIFSEGGEPLPRSLRAFFEPRFGYDFSGVRIHTDSKAAEAAQAVNARAFTVGRDVVFGKGEYMPGAAEGQRLMAHELAHVMQQSAFISPRIQAFTAELDDNQVYIRPEKGDTDADLNRVLCTGIRNRKIAGREKIDVTECLPKGVIKALGLGPINCAELVKMSLEIQKGKTLEERVIMDTSTIMLWHELLKKGYRIASFGRVDEQGKVKQQGNLSWYQNPRMGDLVFMIGTIKPKEGAKKADPAGTNFWVNWDHVGFFIVRSRKDSDYHLAKDGDENPIGIYHTGYVLKPEEGLGPGAYVKGTETLMAYLRAPESEPTRNK